MTRDPAVCPAREPGLAIDRRAFLLGAGAALVWVAVPGCRNGAPLRAELAHHEPRRIARLSELEVGRPVAFRYPWDHPMATNFLVKLEEPAGGGVGPERNVVAFNGFCTHQGGALTLFRADGIAGPCPLHWTTFDLTRHGMVVSGHATQALPQIVLQTDGDDVLATGVLGLVFGLHDHRLDPSGEGAA